jgi:hypothetical protein
MKKLSSVFLVSVLSVALVLSGCTFASAMAQLQKYAPIAIQAIESVVAILVQSGVIKAGQATAVTADVAMASASLQDVENAVAAYNSAASADKNTKLGAVIAALQAAQSQLAQGVKDVGLNGTSNGVLAAESGLQVIITTLAAIEVNLPQPTPAPAWVKANAKKSALKFGHPNLAGQFKGQFNAPVIKYGFGQYALK